MSEPDPITVGLALQASAAAGKEVEDFTSALLGQSGKSIGTIFGEWARYRAQNFKTIFERSEFILLDIGVTPRQIPERLLIPIVAAASLADDPDLQTIWANLFANAADPRQTTPIESVFLRIIEDLGTREIKILNRLYENWQKTGQMMYDQQGIASAYVNATLGRAPALGIITTQESEEFQITLNILLRGQLLSHSVKNEAVTVDQRRYPAGQASRNMQVNMKTLDVYTFTQLGRSFVRACRAPEKPQ